MLSYTAMGTCVLVLTLGTILVVVLVIHNERTGKGVGAAILAALIGILLGAGGTAAGVQLMGYDLAKANTFETPADASTPDGGDAGGMGMGMGSAMGMGGGMGMGGMGEGGMGMGGMMGGGPRGPSAKRQLTTLVRKIDLLSGDISLDLNDQQAKQVVGILQQIKDRDTLSDEAAAELQKELLAVLSEAQVAKQEAISLPRGGRGGGMGMAGGEAPAPDANPFEQEANKTALSSLLGRLGAAPVEAAEARGEEPDDPAAPPNETTPSKPSTDGT